MAIETFAVKLLHVCFGEPRRERPSAKEPNELSANCSAGLLALVKTLHPSGEFQFPATASCCARACRVQELSNNQCLLCPVIHATAATCGLSPAPVAPGGAPAADPSWAQGFCAPAPTSSRETPPPGCSEPTGRLRRHWGPLAQHSRGAGHSPLQGLSSQHRHGPSPPQGTALQVLPEGGGSPCWGSPFSS